MEAFPSVIAGGGSRSPDHFLRVSDSEAFSPVPVPVSVWDWTDWRLRSRPVETQPTEEEEEEETLLLQFEANWDLLIFTVWLLFFFEVQSLGLGSPSMLWSGQGPAPGCCRDKNHVLPFPQSAIAICRCLH